MRRFSPVLVFFTNTLAQGNSRSISICDHTASMHYI